MLSAIEKRKIADTYLNFLSAGKSSELTSLFISDAKVLSPIYGEKSALEFFNTLESDTKNSKLLFKGFFDETDSLRFALFFNYSWEMENGNQSNFDVVDIFELNELGKIVKLQIIYNAGQSAALLNKN